MGRFSRKLGKLRLESVDFIGGTKDNEDRVVCILFFKDNALLDVRDLQEDGVVSRALNVDSDRLDRRVLEEHVLVVTEELELGHLVVRDARVVLNVHAEIGPLLLHHMNLGEGRACTIRCGQEGET